MNQFKKLIATPPTPELSALFTRRPASFGTRDLRQSVFGDATIAAPLPHQLDASAYWQAMAAAAALPLQMVLANCSLQAQQGELALQHRQLTSQERIAATEGHTQQVVAAEGTAQASSQAFNHAVEVREEADAKKVGHIAKAATAAAVAWAGASAAKSMAGADAAKSAATATTAATGASVVAASRFGDSSGRGSIREDSPFTSTLRRAAGAAVIATSTAFPALGIEENPYMATNSNIPFINCDFSPTDTRMGPITVSPDGKQLIPVENVLSFGKRLCVTWHQPEAFVRSCYSNQVLVAVSQEGVKKIAHVIPHREAIRKLDENERGVTFYLVDLDFISSPEFSFHRSDRVFIREKLTFHSGSNELTPKERVLYIGKFIYPSAGGVIYRSVKPNEVLVAVESDKAIVVSDIADFKTIYRRNGQYLAVKRSDIVDAR